MEFPHGFKAMVGAEAVDELLKALDLEALAVQLKENLLSVFKNFAFKDE